MTPAERIIKWCKDRNLKPPRASKAQAYAEIGAAAERERLAKVAREIESDVAPMQGTLMAEWITRQGDSK